MRVAEYRNHWADVLAGYFTGGAIAVFLVRARCKQTVCAGDIFRNECRRTKNIHMPTTRLEI